MSRQVKQSTLESAKEIYLKAVQAICPEVIDKNLAQFTSGLSFAQLNKKELFLQAGKVQRSIGFIVQGLVRSFYANDKGEEITVGFYAENDYATHYAAFLKQQPSLYSIQCLEPTSFALLSFQDLQRMYGESPVFERYGRLVAEEILKRQQARIESFIFQTAEQRYLDFVDNHPALFNRISLSHLSSFLGIERQSLTRIRQKLAR